VVEPFRQPLVDRLTLRILNLGQIGPDDFEGGEQDSRPPIRSVTESVAAPSQQGARPRHTRRSVAGSATLLARMPRRSNTSVSAGGSPPGLRLREEPIKRYFELYEEQMRGESEGESSPPWRDRLTNQVDALRDMVMGGEVEPFYTWAG